MASPRGAMWTQNATSTGKSCLQFQKTKKEKEVWSRFLILAITGVE
jgi:hypothetical protein